MSDAVLLRVDAGVARLTLNRPARLNAFDADMARAWADATTQAVSRGDVKAILLDAAGRAFCAGGDVRAMAEGVGGGAEVTALAQTINAGIRALTDATIPVVAAVQGAAVGGGLGILLCSDYAVMAEDAVAGSRYAQVGLTPDLSVSAQLARAVGERRALQLLLQDRMLSAEEALEWGLVAEVTAPDAVALRAEEVARMWAAGPAAAYGQAKRLVRSRWRRTFAEQLDEEARTIGATFDTADAQARIHAFAAR